VTYLGLVTKKLEANQAIQRWSAICRV